MSATITFVPNGTPYFFQINGTGTSLDGHEVAGVFVLDPATGLPASPSSASTAGGTTPFHLVTVPGLNASIVKATPGQLYGLQVFNTTASPRYLKFYNQIGAPAQATDKPVLVFGIPPYGSVVYTPSVGIAFPVGLVFTTTVGVADTDTTAVSLGDLVINLEYR